MTAIAIIMRLKKNKIGKSMACWLRLTLTILYISLNLAFDFFFLKYDLSAGHRRKTMNNIKIAMAAISIIDTVLVKTRFQFPQGFSASLIYMKLIIDDMNISRKPS